MALVDKYGPSLLRVARMYVSTQRGRRGGRRRHVARGLHGPRALRGPLVAEDLALPDPDEQGEDARRARAPDAALLVVRRRRRRGRHGGRRRPLRARRRTGARRRAASRRSGCSRARRAATVEAAIAALPREPARRDHASRRRGPLGRGGLQRSRAFRDESTCTAPPRTRKGPGRVRAVPGRGPHERRRTET